MNTGLCALQLSYARKGSALFQNVDLKLRPGEGLVIEGANGSGKTSLLRVLAGFIPPTAGRVQWQGLELGKAGALYSEALHYLGHLPGIKGKLTVKENLGYNQYLLGRSLSEEKLEMILQTLHLSSSKDSLAEKLSAGQKKRLALARLLAFPKPLWILDEPFTNLDQAGQHWFHEQLEKHLAGQGLVILASHQAIHFRLKNRIQRLCLPCGATGLPSHV